MSLIFCSTKIYSQIHFEVGGGYLFELPNQNVFNHTSEGWQLNGSVVYHLSDVIELKTSVVYQERTFDPNSFQFIVPDVVGYSIPIIESGDNIKSFGVYFGGRFVESSKKILKPTFSLDMGLTYFKDSYFETKYINIEQKLESSHFVKYFESNLLFESSAGLGFLILPAKSINVLIEVKANYLPVEKIIYFPIITSLRFSI
jgi:hypothetical protein